MNLKGSEHGHKETKEIKDYKSPYQKRYRETGRQTYKQCILHEVNGVSNDKDV